MLMLDQKQQQIRKKSFVSFHFFQHFGFYGTLCTLHRTKSGFESTRQDGNGRTNKFKFCSSTVGLIFCVRTSYMSTFTSMVISCESDWSLNLKPNVIGWSYTYPHLVGPTGGEPWHQFVFSRSRLVWSSFRGGVSEAVIGSRWGGPCVPPWWCQPWWRGKAWRDGCERWRRRRYVRWARMSGRRPALQVYRWADWQQLHRQRTKTKQNKKKSGEKLMGWIFLSHNIKVQMKITASLFNAGNWRKGFFVI